MIWNLITIRCYSSKKIVAFTLQRCGTESQRQLPVISPGKIGQAAFLVAILTACRRQLTRHTSVFSSNLMESDFISVKDATWQTGKSERTLRRYIEQRANDYPNDFKQVVHRGRRTWVLKRDALLTYYDVPDMPARGTSVDVPNDTTDATGKRRFMDKWLEENKSIEPPSTGAEADSTGVPDKRHEADTTNDITEMLPENLKNNFVVQYLVKENTRLAKENSATNKKVLDLIDKMADQIKPNNTLVQNNMAGLPSSISRNQSDLGIISGSTEPQVGDSVTEADHVVVDVIPDDAIDSPAKKSWWRRYWHSEN